MNKKEIVVKHAVEKVVAVLRIIVIPAFLLYSRGTLMNVQAACETPAQQENIMEEAQLQVEAEEVTQIPEESVEEETQTKAESVEEQAEIVEEPLSVTMVGDSVMLGASPAILGMMPDCVIDAKVSRQVIQAHDVLDSLEKQGSLRQTVVIGLGTNGPFSTATGQEIIDQLGNGRTVYWVTAYGRDLRWQEESNATIRKLAEDNENVHVIDWAQAASGHAEWFCADGIHLSAQGRTVYAGIVLEGLF